MRASAIKRPLLLLALIMGLFATLMLFMLPDIAQARSYTMDPVNIDMTVNTDGSVDVSEQRTFNFTVDSGDNNFRGVYWIYDAGDAGGYEINNIYQVTSSGKSAYTKATGNAQTPGTFTVAKEGTQITITVYFAESQPTGSATYEVDYTANGAVTAHKDVGELYMTYVREGWDVDSENVNLTLHLPVPSGESVSTGESGNTRAWGHGELDGETTFNSDGTISFVSPVVSTDSFAACRVTFPVSWLTGMTPSSDSALDSIVAEETDYANAANQQRAKARAIIYGGGGISLAVCIGAFIAALLSFFKYGKEYKPKFKDKYLREMPSDDHPAVLGTVWNKGEIDDHFFTASIMRLANLKAVRLQKIAQTENTFFGSKVKDDYIVTLVPSAQPNGFADPIDQCAYAFLADIAGDSLSFKFSDIEKWGKDHSEGYLNNVENWRGQVKAVGIRRGFYEAKGKGLKGLFIFIGLLMICAMAFFVGPMAVETSDTAAGVFITAVAIIGALLGVAIMVIGTKMDRRSVEAAELKARCDGLYNWLNDFTNLKEDPPMEVAVWKNFLVMAVVFGIADKVIKQMQVAVPEVLADADMGNTVIWVNPSNDTFISPINAIDTRIGDTKSELFRAAQAASGHDSSGGGFGGGFSGGGGGFGGGGGGGGGAF